MKNFIKSNNINVKLTLLLVNIALICLVLALLYSIHPVIFYVSGVVIGFLTPLLIALTFAMATYPLIQYFKITRKWNDKIAKMVSILIVLTMLIIFFALLIPLLLNLVHTTFPKLKDLYEHLVVPLFAKFGIDVSNVMKYINLSLILSWITNFGSNFLIIMILYLFIVIDIDVFRKFIKQLILSSKRQKFIQFSKMFDSNFKNYIKALIGYAGLAIIYYGSLIFLLSIFWIHNDIIQYPWYMLAVLFGVFVIIPYVGPVFGVGITSLTMLQYGNTAAIVMFIGLTIATQIDLNLIQLKIIGNKLKLNPVIIMMTILLSSSLIGFSGILITPILLVLIKTLIDLYEQKINKIHNYEHNELGDKNEIL